MKKTLCIVLCAIMLVSLILPAFTLSVSADAAVKTPAEVIGTGTEISVNWVAGYIGSNTHTSYKNKQSGASGVYNVSDVITIPKAGTKIYFTDKNTGDDGLNYISNTAYLFSSWKQSGDNWVIDLTGPNVMGSYENDWIGQRKIGKTAAEGMLYEFVSDHDNQTVRLCYRTVAGEEKPKVYMVENCGEPSTKELWDGMSFTAVQKAGSDPNSGTFEGLRWFTGYIGSATNTNGSANEYRPASDTYRTSGMFKVEKAGTEVSFTTSGNPNNAFYALAKYKYEGGRYVFESGFDATSQVIRTGSNPYTYTYTTNADNEILAVGFRTVSWTDKTVEATDGVTVNWKYAGGAGTGSVQLKTEWPDAELVSVDTGVPLIGTEVKTTWHHGYIGSQYHDSASFISTSPNNAVYYYTDVIEVPKAGTDVVFFDQTFTDFDGGTNASTSVLTVSHWLKGRLNQKKTYLTGCDVYNKIVDEYYRVYRYTTTEDNESIVLCLRLAPKYSGEDALIPPVYLVEKQAFDLKSGKFADPSGKTVEYKVYLPADYDTADTLYPVIFDMSEKGEIAAAAQGKNYIAVSCPGEGPESLRLMDTIMRYAKARISDLTLVGGDATYNHLKKYQTLRFCAKFIYTGSAATSKISGTTTVKLSACSDAADAFAKADANTVPYYDVLQGLTMYAIGDSYFGGSELGQHQTWINMIGYKYAMTYHNFGIGGNTVANYDPLSANQPPMYKRIDELPAGGNIYVVEGGRNDRHYSVPFGDNDSTDKNTFKGALNSIINAIKAKTPDAFIVLVTPWYYLSEGKGAYLGTNNDYADAMKQLVEYRNDPSIVCLYAADKNFSKIDAGDASIRAKYFIAGNDVSHMNVDGMSLVEPIFEEWIAKAYASYLGVSPVNAVETNVVTTAEISTAEVTNVTPETDPAPAKKGCGSAASFIVAIAVAGGACIIGKKRKERN